MEEIGQNKSFGGRCVRYRHDSKECGCPMTLSIYYPPAAEQGTKVPAIYFLSGLTCTDENFMAKAGAHRLASQLNVALIAPDTSPRGLGIEGEDDNWDFGTGAGFYLDATESKWQQYRMYSYVTKELPELLRAHATNLDLDNVAIMGHSMGGHGALTIGLKHSDKYKSISALSPICNPINCPWGQKAFNGYLGPNQDSWKQYDATELLKEYKGKPVKILIDVGTDDKFLTAGQLLPEALQQAHESGTAAQTVDLNVRMQEGYDHSYFFIATVIDDHIRHAASALGIKC